MMAHSQSSKSLLDNAEKEVIMPYVGIGSEKHQARQSLVGKPMIKVYVIIACALLGTIGVGLLGKYHSENPAGSSKPESLQDIHRHISHNLQDGIDPERIKSNLRALTKEPHMAGTDANKRVSQTIQRLWNEAGLEDVHTVSYDVLLSYPEYDKPNRVFIRDSNGREIFSTNGTSPVIIPDEQGAKFAGHQWLAWASPGKVTAEVVYANRGSQADFLNLKKMGVDPTGKIVMMRFGEGFRGDKVKMAEKFGAAGVILFSDPFDIARDGTDDAHVYPKTLWMPPEGVQRGSLAIVDGDPLTPLYPSKKSLYPRRTIGQAKKDHIIPSIPALPISYTTAYQILERMKGRPVPITWQGEINTTYRIGPGFKNGETLTIDVNIQFQTRKIRNVIGYLHGHDEPDRYVILGNHYDAWVYGSLDPNSGTAVLAEVARSMAQAINETYWRPSRTIMFAAWDAEEHGLIGSTEFVEEFTEMLQQRAVVYINMDCIQGNTSLTVESIPSLYGSVIEAAKRVENPNKTERQKGRNTVYDTWLKTFPDKQWIRPQIPVPSGGSDQAAFMAYAGVPIINFSFHNASIRDTYPLYHTLYETPFLNEHLLDTDNFAVHKAVGQYWAELARMFADEITVPSNYTELAVSFIKEYIPEIRKALAPLQSYHAAIEPANNQLTSLFATVQEFLTATQKFNSTVAFTRYAFQMNPYDTRTLNAVNERIMSISRCFINPRGLPGAPHSRHVLYSVSTKDAYAGSVMAGVTDAIEDFVEAKTDIDRKDRGREIAFQLSVVTRAVQCAVAMLKNHI